MRYTVLSCIVTSAIWSILNPPYKNLSLNFMSGVLSAWYIVWSITLLLVYNVQTFKRVQKQNGHVARSYYWEPLPKALSYRRIFWAMDLTTNFRGIGWDHVSSKAKLLPPLIHSLNQEQSGTPGGQRGTNPNPAMKEDQHFLTKQLWRVLRAYFWLEVYHLIGVDRLNILGGGRDTVAIKGFCQLAFATWNIAGPVVAIYALLDGIHALLTIVAVGLLTSSCVQAAGEAWMYPPLFGSIRVMRSGRYQTIWASLWHDVLKSGLVSISGWLVPRTQPRSIVRLLRVWLCFFISGLIHAAGIYAATVDKMSAFRIFLFFCAQPIGIIIQLLSSKVALTILPDRPASSRLIYAINWLTGLLWIYITLHLLSGNMALRAVLHDAAEVVRLPRGILHL